jgi:hypothetical protein
MRSLPSASISAAVSSAGTHLVVGQGDRGQGGEEVRRDDLLGEGEFVAFCRLRGRFADELLLVRDAALGKGLPVAGEAAAGGADLRPAPPRDLIQSPQDLLLHGLHWTLHKANPATAHLSAPERQRALPPLHS